MGSPPTDLSNSAECDTDDITSIRVRQTKFGFLQLFEKMEMKFQLKLSNLVFMKQPPTLLGIGLYSRHKVTLKPLTLTSFAN